MERWSGRVDSEDLFNNSVCVTSPGLHLVRYRGATSLAITADIIDINQAPPAENILHSPYTINRNGTTTSYVYDRCLRGSGELIARTPSTLSRRFTHT